MLEKHARHYQTGEAIPDELIAKLKAARRFNQDSTPSSTAHQRWSIWHCTPKPISPALMPPPSSARNWQRIGMPADIIMRHRLAHFRHLFAGSSYSSQYYVYLWAEVLDADGYDAFIEAGSPFDAGVAKRLLENIYSTGKFA